MKQRLLNGFACDQADKLFLRVHNRQGVHFILGHKAFGLFDRRALFDRSHGRGHEAANGKPGFGLLLKEFMESLVHLSQGQSFNTGGGGHGMPGPPECLGDLVHVHVRVATAPDELNFPFHGHGGQDGVSIVELA